MPTAPRSRTRSTMHSLASRCLGPCSVSAAANCMRSHCRAREVLYLTEIEREFAGDARFPPWPRAAWREVAREAGATDEGLRYAFVTYVRASANGDAAGDRCAERRATRTRSLLPMLDASRPVHEVRLSPRTRVRARPAIFGDNADLVRCGRRALSRDGRDASRNPFAGMTELVDVADSKSADSDIVGVRVPLPAPKCFGVISRSVSGSPKLRKLLILKKNPQTSTPDAIPIRRHPAIE